MTKDEKKPSAAGKAWLLCKKKVSRAGTCLRQRPFTAAVLIAVGMALFNEIASRRSVLKGFLFLFTKPVLFLCNASLILVFLCLAFFSRKRKYWTLFFSVFWFGMGVTNFVVQSFRQTPFSFMDFLLLKGIFSILPRYLTVPGFIAVLLLVLAAVGVLIFLWFRTEKKPWMIKKAVFSLLAAGALAAVSIESSLLMHWIPNHFSNLIDAYRSYGFTYCFASGIIDRGIARPADYESTVDDVLAAIEAADHTHPVADKGRRPNIIFLQLESFIDLQRMQGFSFSADPTPVFTELRKTCPHGWLTVPTIGAGTVNTEFEILTGMDIAYFGAGEYPYETILQKTACESLCTVLKEKGYTAHAVHDYKGGFYDRDSVFANLGFDTFTSLEYIADAEKNILDWAEDTCMTDYIMDCLSSTEGSDFVFCITVQAHGKYPTDEYDDAGESISVTSLPEGANKNSVTYYVNQLSGTDAFVGELLSDIRKTGEDTVVVMYGDHLPNLNIKEEWLPEGTDLYDTEYLIWDSHYFRSSAEEEKLEAFRLGTAVLDRLGLDDRPISALHRNFYGSEVYPSYLQMLEYDILYGDAVTYKEKLPVPSELKMGIRDIIITDAYTETTDGEERLVIKGENFTEASRIFIGGFQRSTDRIDGQTLVTDYLPDDGDELRIVQITDYIFRLSSSDSFTYREK